MRFPHPDLHRICFSAEDPDTLIKIMGVACQSDEAQLISKLCEAGLPPATSSAAVATMFGYNPGFVGALLKKPKKQYRYFTIAKGGKKEGRPIAAPKVGLKLIQRWLNYHWSLKWRPPQSVHGFVAGRSHVSAAKSHVNASWVISADIENFFPSIKLEHVDAALIALGYEDAASRDLCKNLVCLDGALSQGAPTSPLLSNIVLKDLDEALIRLATETDSIYTRYADDIVFSGKNEIPEGLAERIREIIVEDGWKISEGKFEISILPMRLKVHGLLVHRDEIRLTKGYRNKIRAYRHLMKSGKVSEEDISTLSGHLAFADFVEKQ